MPQNKIHILSTRPLEQGLIDKAATKNILLDAVSFIDTEMVGDDSLKATIDELAQQPLTIVFTSMNAVDAVANYVGEKKMDWKIFAIGNTTKNLVKEKFGATHLSGTADSASALADTIIKENKSQSLVFFCGDQRRDELPTKLSQHGIGVKEIVVYKTIATSHPINKKYDGILFYSPSAVHSFFSSNKVSHDCVFFSIGKTTAEAIKKFTDNKIIVANEPSKALLVEQAIQYFETDPIHHR